MTVQMRVMPAVEADQGFGLLKDIVEMVKNPKAIDEAYERRRKAAQLSDDEVKKAEEARALMAQADALKDELQQHADALAAARAGHLNAVSIHTQQVESENARLAEWEVRLNEAASTQAEQNQRLAEERKKLDDRAAQIEASHAARMDEYNEKLSAMSEVTMLQNERNTRLIAWETKLKAKAARLAAEAQSEE